MMNAIRWNKMWVLSVITMMLIITMLFYLPTALGEEQAVADADLGELVALIGAENTADPEHAFALNHLLGRTYRMGDGGSEITMIKDRMKALGYYTPKAAYNKRFNEMMKERVADFQENNGLLPTGVIDEETLMNLFDADAVKGPHYPAPYDEPELTMIIPQGSRLRSIQRRDGVLSVGVEVKNISYQKRIIGYYLSVYTVDSDGKKLQEEIFDTTGMLSCGAKRYCDYVNLENSSEIDKVYFGIKKVYYRDGSRTETIETPQYHGWEL